MPAPLLPTTPRALPHALTACRAVNIGGIPQPVECTFTVGQAPTPSAALAVNVQAIQTVGTRPNTLMTQMSYYAAI